MSDSAEPTKPRRRAPVKSSTAGKNAASPGADKSSTNKSGAKSVAKSTTRTSRTRRAAASPVTAEQRHRMIAEAAYLIAESQGFDHSRSLDHWLAAEAQIDSMLSGTTRH